MGNVIVDESELNSLNETIAKEMKELNHNIDTYISIMEKICQNSVISGELHDKMEAFLAAAKVLQDKPSMLAQKYRIAESAFLSSVDRADQFLY